jgi:uncharacterized membrane protein required for colicin V production
MMTIDILVASYLGWGFYRGQRRGFRAETARIVGLVLTLAFLLGLGLFTQVKNSLSALAVNLLQHRGIVVSVLVLLSTVFIIVLFRIRLRRRQKSSRSSEEHPAYGGMAGVVRALLLVIIILFGFDLFLPDFLNNAIVGDSVTGQALEILKNLHLMI